MADRHKRELLDRMGWVVDTVAVGNPKIVSGDGFRQGLKQLSREPFRLVPYYAPEVWGGQWMREICEIDGDADNYAWAFDGVPEENSIFLRFGEVRMEFPAIDVVFYRPKELLGSRVHARFGDEFPIRFDFLDTVGGAEPVPAGTSPHRIYPEYLWDALHPGRELLHFGLQR